MEIKHMVGSDLGRWVKVDTGEGADGAPVMQVARVKSYSNGDKLAYVVFAAKDDTDWRSKAGKRYYYQDMVFVS